MVIIMIYYIIMAIKMIIIRIYISAHSSPLSSPLHHCDPPRWLSLWSSCDHHHHCDLYSDVHPLPDARICISRLVLLNVAHRDVNVVDLHLIIIMMMIIIIIIIMIMLLLKDYKKFIPHRDFSGLRSLPGVGTFQHSHTIGSTTYQILYTSAKR